MRHSVTLLSALSAWFLAGTARSYQIHTDCGEDTQLVREMVENAFVYSNMALEKVKPENMGEGSFALKIGKLLFGADSPAEVITHIITETFGQGAENPNGVTLGIKTFEEEKKHMDTDVYKDLPKEEVVIFCTTDRLEKGSNGRMYDNIAKGDTGPDDGCGTTDFMWTFTFADHWDEIQICPWFLQYAKAMKYKTKEGITSKRAKLAVSGLGKLITNLVMVPIDAMNLWDLSMLHEFMHTKSGGEKDDIGKGRDPYGWKNCRRIAGEGRGLTNADNYALFGSAIYQESQGSPIDDDGKFTNAPAKAKRQLESGVPGGKFTWINYRPKRWVGSGAVEAMGAVKAGASRDSL